ncbi:5160_t:CDS:2, partial [Scutellospora calospora]
DCLNQNGSIPNLIEPDPGSNDPILGLNNPIPDHFGSNEPKTSTDPIGKTIILGLLDIKNGRL